MYQNDLTANVMTFQNFATADLSDKTWWKMSPEEEPKCCIRQLLKSAPGVSLYEPHRQKNALLVTQRAQCFKMNF